MAEDVILQGPNGEGHGTYPVSGPKPGQTFTVEQPDGRKKRYKITDRSSEHDPTAPYIAKEIVNKK